MSNSWSDLVPGDIFSLIAEHLSFEDLVRLGVVCKTWRPVVLEAIQHHPIMCMPWLTSHDPWNSTMRIGPIFNNIMSTTQTYHSLKQTVVSEEVKQLDNACVCASGYGWLLLLDLEQKDSSAVLFFYNPFLNEIIELPSFETGSKIKMHGFENECITRVIFTAPPTSLDCVIYVVSERRTVRNSRDDHFRGDIRDRRTISNIKTCSLKDGRWSRIHESVQSGDGIGDVVYIDGVLHCLYYDESDGSFKVKLLIFDVTLESWTAKNYKILLAASNATAAEEWYMKKNPDKLDGRFYCLVKLNDGELLLVIRYPGCVYYHSDLKESYWQVYRLDLAENSWSTLVHGFRNQVLLMNEQEFRDDRRKQWSALAVPTVGEAKKYANMIVVVEGRRCLCFTCNNEGQWRYDATVPLEKEKGYYSWIERPM